MASSSRMQNDIVKRPCKVSNNLYFFKIILVDAKEQKFVSKNYYNI